MKLSGLAQEVKKALIDTEGRVTRSEVYFTNIETGEELRLSMTPEKIEASTAANFRTYNIVERGEVRLPKGEKLTQLKWQGILPGAGMLLYPFLTHDVWEPPLDLIKVFERWRTDGAKLKLLVTQTPFNLDVFIQSFDVEASGGMGDYKYNIGLTAAKDLQILTVAEADTRRQQLEETRANQLNNRAAMKSTLGKRISEVNNIWAIVKILTGTGSWSDVEKVSETYGLDDPTDFQPGDLIIWG